MQLPHAALEFLAKVDSPSMFLAVNVFVLRKTHLWRTHQGVLQAMNSFWVELGVRLEELEVVSLVVFEVAVAARVESEVAVAALVESEVAAFSPVVFEVVVVFLVELMVAVVFLVELMVAVVFPVESMVLLAVQTDACVLLIQIVVMVALQGTLDLLV